MRIRLRSRGVLVLDGPLAHLESELRRRNFLVVVRNPDEDIDDFAHGIASGRIFVTETAEPFAVLAVEFDFALIETGVGPKKPGLAKQISGELAKLGTVPFREPFILRLRDGAPSEFETLLG